MRLTTVILLGTMLHLSAATFGQKLNYVNKNVSLEQLFKEIKKQTNYNVVWYEGKLNTATTINADFSNASLDQVMNKALSGLPLTYTIRQNNIVIKEKTPSLLDKVISHFKNTTLFGKVTDEKGNPLPGATIRIKDTKTAVLSNKDGNFSIESKELSGVLFISFLGYKPTEISFSPTNPGPFTVTLKEDESILNEVQINAGYYTVSDRERTGSISKITAETIGKQPISNPLQALQGRVPGLQITQQTGVPGGGFTVQIRGQNSIANGNNPLYVIDNIIYPSIGISSPSLGGLFGLTGDSPLSMITPNDIESIEILKDADATAIYGSKGANGVILIKTKRGQNSEMKINANFFQGFSKVARHLKLLNTDEYLEMRKEAITNDGLTPTSTDYDINGTWNANKYTDWQKEIIGGTANTTTAALNLSGGNDNITYFLGGNYYQEGTVFPGDFGFKRGGIQSSLELGPSKNRFHVSFTTNYSHTQSDLMREDITRDILLAPNAPNLLDENGLINWDNNTLYENPIASLLRSSDSGADNLLINTILNYRIAKDLIIKTSLGYSVLKRDDYLTTPLSSYAPAYGFNSSFRSASYSNSSNRTFMAEPQITYKSKIGPGEFDALIGMTFQNNKSGSSTITGTGFNSDEVLENISAAATLKSRSFSYQYRYVAFFTRLNYNINNKYLLNLTARRDGSSRFGEDKRFANFGAAGAAWIFSDEHFFRKNLTFLSFGKLRASYGITGNDQIPDYQYLQLWANGLPYQGLPTNVPDNIANKDFAWENNRKLEAALQIGLINNKVNIEISWYRNRSSNQLIGDPLPPSTGNFSVMANRPATVQNTGWEFQTNFKILNKINWQWSIGGNLTIPKNKLISYPSLESSSDAYNYIIGQPLSIKRIYNVRGINSQTGLYDIEDRNGDGLINDEDRYLYKFTGQYFYGGLSNSVTYKNFNLDFLIAFTKQNSSNNYMNNGGLSLGYWDYTGPTSNFPVITLQRWRQPGDITSIQKASTSYESYVAFDKARTYGGESISDASFIRLKNVSLSYNIPKKVLNRLKICDAKISLQGQNIFTITKYLGLDPESQSISTLPPLRTLSIGLNLTL